MDHPCHHPQLSTYIKPINSFLPEIWIKSIGKNNVSFSLKKINIWVNFVSNIVG